jgi:glycosyltransferase involved in cell wall biosynthesis
MMRIVMLGASLDQNGGIATVEKLILQGLSFEFSIRHITSHDEGTVFHRIVVFSRAMLSLTWQLLTAKPDLVHIHVSDGGSILRKAILTSIARTFGKPVVMHAHGAEFDKAYLKLPKLVQSILNKIYCSCSRFIVLSKTWATFYESCLGLLPEQTVILPNPTELPAQLPDRSHLHPVNFAFLGRIGKRKGAFDLIQAFAHLPTEYQSQSHLLLAGDGEVEQAQALAKSLHVQDKITFLGWIDANQRNQVLQAADVFVLPSYHEGLPMAILEAMGWQLPIISTPVGGIPELIIPQQNGLLVPPGDVQQLSESMQCLIQNKAFRLQLGLAARKAVEPFDIKDYCRNLAEIYRSIFPSTDRPD